MVNRSSPASGTPDVLFAFASVGWTMAIFFLLASFFDPDLTKQDAGPPLAQMFAAALATCATFTFILGFVLLRDDRRDISHYFTPMILGFVAGLLTTSLFLNAAGAWIFAPFVLLIFSIRGVRRAVARMLGRTPAGLV